MLPPSMFCALAKDANNKVQAKNKTAVNLRENAFMGFIGFANWIANIEKSDEHQDWVEFQVIGISLAAPLTIA